MHDRQWTARSSAKNTPLGATERISLAQLMQRHAAVIRKVPGQEVEMTANTLGCERACIYTLPSSAEPEPNIQLLFSIIAFDNHSKPIATLALMESYARVQELNLLPPLLDTSQDALIEYLKGKEAPLSAYTAIDSYIDALRSVIESVGDDIAWA